MNALEGIQIDEFSFAFRDLQGLDTWTNFTPVFTSLTVVGATSYSGRFRIVGRQCFFQVQFSAATSIASTSGTTTLTVPVAQKGIGGNASMTNKTTHAPVDECDVDGGFVYLPTQGASGNVFKITGWCEV